jgi:surface polysaccharide O-acyltransferase-like enzyme
MRRLAGLDVIRGVGILAVVFLHSATFYYQGITTIDWDDPPLLIQVIGFLLMWAGLFAVVSSAAYAYSMAKRIANGEMRVQQLVWNWVVAGGFLLVLHYVYFVALAPKLLDVVGGAHMYSLIPGWIATGKFPPVYPERMFYSTALSMVAWNLLLIGPLLWALIRRRGLPQMKRNGAILGGLGTALILLSLARIPLYPLSVDAIDQGTVISAIGWGFLVGKNNPILPYVGFGLFGTWFGLALAQSQTPRRVLSFFSLVGMLWLIAGIVGLFLLPTTMLEREIDLYWYLITLFLLGLSLLLVSAASFVFDFGAKTTSVLRRALVPVRRLGKVSLSIFCLETVLSQILVVVADVLFGGWRRQMSLCLAFGAFCVLLWMGLVALWAQFGFLYSMEWLTVQVHALFKRPSAKMAAHDLAHESD